MPYKNILLFKASKFYNEKFGRWPIKSQAVKEFIDQSEADICLGNISPTSKNDVYDPDMEKNLWREYKRRSVNSVSDDNVPFTFNLVEKSVDHLIKPGSVVVNFGAMYAWPEHNLARKYPEARFFSIDRSEEIKNLNDVEFPQENLDFIAQDIF